MSARTLPLAIPARSYGRGLLDRGRRSLQASAMSWCLSVHVRRIIAVVLLLFDLSREPDSALAFVGLDTDDDGVAELCTKDDFWWGNAASCAIHEATAAGRHADYADHTSGRGSPPVTASASAERSLVTACHCAIIFATLAVVPTAPLPFETVLSESGLPSGKHVHHRNTYVAQKRDIVLIV